MKNKYCWQTETCVTQQSYGFIIHFQVSQTEIRQLYVSYIRHLFTSLLFHAWKRSDQKGERTLNNLWRRGPKHPKFPHEYKQAKIRSTQQQLRLWRHLQLLFFLPRHHTGTHTGKSFRLDICAQALISAAAYHTRQRRVAWLSSLILSTSQLEESNYRELEWPNSLLLLRCDEIDFHFKKKKLKKIEIFFVKAGNSVK